MKKLSLLILLSFLSNILFAQKIELSESELKIQLDSVLLEGNMLYRYEKAAWVSGDLAMENISIRNNVAGYFVYEEQNDIIVIILGEEGQSCIAEYSFGNDFSKPKSEKIESRELSEKEKTLIEVRNNILDNISEPKYGVTVPNGYAANIILLPFADKYKFYVIMGTHQHDIIPFGNDYLFIADKNGVIESWKKFHSNIIPGYTVFEGNIVTKLVHSHLYETPLMTTTDICTFMLYGPMCDMDSFSVYSPALKKYMTYSFSDNEITIE